MATRPRLSILGVAYAALLVLAIAAWFVGNFPVGVLSAVPLLLIAYHTRPRVALITAIIAGFVFGYVNDTARLVIRFPAFLEGALITCALMTIVVVAERLRRHSMGLMARLERAEEAAVRDVLTELPNRRAFEARLNQAIAEEKEKNGQLAVLFADLDGFKAVNDTYGHAIGDRALAAAGGRLGHSMRESDFVARLGGDEFGIIVKHIHTRSDLTHMYDSITNAFLNPFTIQLLTLQLGISIGIAIYPENGQDAAALLNHADKEMYAAKFAKKKMATG